MSSKKRIWEKYNMKTLIILLRGINVGGNNKIKMTDLKELCERCKLENIQTYIQSGNIVCQTAQTKDNVAKLLQQAITTSHKFTPEVLVFEKKEITAIVKQNPYAKKDTKKQYFTLLNSPPSKENVTAFNKEDHSPEEHTIKKNVIYLYFPDGYGRAKLNNNVLEKKLKVQATTRNWNTMQKLIELSD